MGKESSYAILSARSESWLCCGIVRSVTNTRDGLVVNLISMHFDIFGERLIVEGKIDRYRSGIIRGLNFRLRFPRRIDGEIEDAD